MVRNFLNFANIYQQLTEFYIFKKKKHFQLIFRIL